MAEVPDLRAVADGAAGVHVGGLVDLDRGVVGQRVAAARFVLQAV